MTARDAIGDTYTCGGYKQLYPLTDEECAALDEREARLKRFGALPAVGAFFVCEYCFFEFAHA